MNDFSISEKSQKELLSIARQSIAGFLRHKSLPRLTVTDPELKQPAAVFVTLARHHHLRGCIGTTAPQYPLFEAVGQMAIAAAVEDYRFPPVTLEELEDIRIEISVLSPMRKVKNADEIQQGEHGVMVHCGGRSGLFLPQVWEHFDRKEDFCNELCLQKAGLPSDSWKKPGTDLHVFTVFSFKEE